MQKSKTRIWKLGAAITIFVGVLFFAQIVFAVEFPKYTGFVNDYAGVLTADFKSNLEATLRDFKAKTSNEVVIVIVKDFQGLDPFSYSQQLFTTWKIGSVSKNNGILFLIGPKESLPFPERGEAFINVGGGLEGAMPDSLTGSILRNEVFPKFKDGKFEDGLSAGILAMMQATQGEYQSTGDTGGESSSVPGGFINLLMWGGFILISYLTSFLARTKSWWLGGVLGTVGGAVLGFIFLSGVMILVPIIGVGAIGLIFDLVVSKNYQQRLKEGKPTDFWHSGGGFWFGGGGRGGGFGGFGGGTSRGGGAGGGW